MFDRLHLLSHRLAPGHFLICLVECRRLFSRGEIKLIDDQALGKTGCRNVVEHVINGAEMEGCIVMSASRMSSSRSRDGDTNSTASSAAEAAGGVGGAATGGGHGEGDVGSSAAVVTTSVVLSMSWSPASVLSGGDVTVPSDEHVVDQWLAR